VEPVRTRQDITNRILANRARISKLGVTSLALFGSFARDEAHSASDVDLIVEFKPREKTFDHFMDLSFLLEDLLGRTVELLTPTSLSRHMGSKILKESVHVPLAA
jgi:predicted nucleotidyltransferase